MKNTFLQPSYQGALNAGLLEEGKLGMFIPDLK